MKENDLVRYDALLPATQVDIGIREKGPRDRKQYPAQCLAHRAGHTERSREATTAQWTWCGVGMYVVP